MSLPGNVVRRYVTNLPTCALALLLAAACPAAALASPAEGSGAGGSLLAGLLGTQAASSASTTLQEDLFTYSVNADDNSATVVSYNGDQAVVNVPSTLGGATVVAVGPGAFSHNETLTAVTLPNTVTAVSDYAFAGCTALGSVELGSGLAYLGAGAFQGCTALAEVTLPASLTAVGMSWNGTSSVGPFAGCDALATVTVAEGLQSLPAYLLYGLSVETLTLELPDSLAEAPATALPQTPCAVTVVADPNTFAQQLAAEQGWVYVDPNVHAESVALDQASLYLMRGTSQALAALVAPDGVTDPLVWTSSDPAVASVSQDGAVTAEKAGSATVTLEVSGLAASCEVTVWQPVTSIALTRDAFSIEADETRQLVATCSPEDATNKQVVWSSSDPAVATVNAQTGLVTGVAEGTCTVTATAADGAGATKSCTVTVTSNSYVAAAVEELQSPHPYANSCTDAWTYTLPGAAALLVTFDQRTNLENTFDTVEVYDGTGDLLGTYTGSELAGTVLTVPGDTVRVKLDTDEVVDGWGFAVASVERVEPRGWVVVGGVARYYVDGKPWRGELKLDDGWHYFDPATGAMVTGFARLPDGRLVYYDDHGVMATGDVTINNVTYNFNVETGDLVQNETTVVEVNNVTNVTTINNNQVVVIEQAAEEEQPAVDEQPAAEEPTIDEQPAEPEAEQPAEDETTAEEAAPEPAAEETPAESEQPAAEEVPAPETEQPAEEQPAEAAPWNLSVDGLGHVSCDYFTFDLPVAWRGETDVFVVDDGNGDPRLVVTPTGDRDHVLATFYLSAAGSEVIDGDLSVYRAASWEDGRGNRIELWIEDWTVVAASSEGVDEDALATLVRLSSGGIVTLGEALAGQAVQQFYAAETIMDTMEVPLYNEAGEVVGAAEPDLGGALLQQVDEPAAVSLDDEDWEEAEQPATEEAPAAEATPWDLVVDDSGHVSCDYFEFDLPDIWRGQVDVFVVDDGNGVPRLVVAPTGDREHALAIFYLATPDYEETDGDLSSYRVASWYDERGHRIELWLEDWSVTAPYLTDIDASTLETLVNLSPNGSTDLAWTILHTVVVPTYDENGALAATAGPVLGDALEPVSLALSFDNDEDLAAVTELLDVVLAAYPADELDLEEPTPEQTCDLALFGVNAVLIADGAQAAATFDADASPLDRDGFTASLPADDVLAAVKLYTGAELDVSQIDDEHVYCDGTDVYFVMPEVAGTQNGVAMPASFEAVEGVEGRYTVAFDELGGAYSDNVEVGTDPESGEPIVRAGVSGRVCTAVVQVVDPGDGTGRQIQLVRLSLALPDDDEQQQETPDAAETGA
jgi:hypothetical protein